MITVGSTVSDRAGEIASEGNTVINLNNPCDGSGVISTAGMQFSTGDADGTGVKVALFYQTTGNYYRCRSTYAIDGAVTKGSAQSKTVSLTAVKGDCIGWHCDDGQMERDTSGGSGLMWVAGDQCTVGTEVEYALLADDIASIYGSGGWANVTQVLDKASVNILTVNDQAATRIGSINGKAV